MALHRFPLPAAGQVPLGHSPGPGRGRVLQPTGTYWLWFLGKEATATERVSDHLCVLCKLTFLPLQVCGVSRTSAAMDGAAGHLAVVGGERRGKMGGGGEGTRCPWKGFSEIQASCSQVMAQPGGASRLPRGDFSSYNGKDRVPGKGEPAVQMVTLLPCLLSPALARRQSHGPAWGGGLAGMQRPGRWPLISQRVLGTRALLAFLRVQNCPLQVTEAETEE